MNILFCAVWQTDRISLPPAIDRIQVTNYSWTHDRKSMKLHLKHQLSYNKCTLLSSMPSHTDQNLVNLFFLSSDKEEKEVKIQPLPSPGCCYAMLRNSSHSMSPRTTSSLKTDCSALSYHSLSEKSQRRKMNRKLIFLVSAKR